MVTRPELGPGLRELILGALEAPYVSESCCDNVQTGNHYQSVSLGPERTEGFRSARTEILDQIAFHDKDVLDLGSNLGELSRAARIRGARLVDGYELDPFFVDVANAINAYNRTSRVSFHVRDITDPAAYTEEYDIVLAFSVAHYVYSVLDVLARITRQLLVLETHRLEDNLESQYIAPLKPHFPVHEILGSSEWSVFGHESEKRAVVAFAKDERALALGLSHVPALSRGSRVPGQEPSHA
jgi:SAM-dependent methyltransferase